MEPCTTLLKSYLLCGYIKQFVLGLWQVIVYRAHTGLPNGTFKNNFSIYNSYVTSRPEVE